MNEKLINSPGPMRAIDILPEWIEARRAIVIRDGHAVRASRRLIEATSFRTGDMWYPVIEIQSINEPTVWGTLTLPNNKPHFASIADCNEILFKLWGRDNLQRQPEPAVMETVKPEPVSGPIALLKCKHGTDLDIPCVECIQEAEKAK